jgi:hypothetical protein
MKLTSNIGQVKGRLQRLQEGIPAAVEQAIAPTYWRARLEYVATKTLRAQWALERNVQTRALYERLTPRIVATLTGESAGGVSRFTLGLPEDLLAAGLGIRDAVDYQLNQRTPAGRTKKYAFQEPDREAHLQQVRQSLRDWVTLEKRRDERDQGLTDEQIAQRLEEILGLSDRAVPRERTPAMEAAANDLMQAIESWMAGEGDSPAVQSPQSNVQGPTVAPEVVQQWMGAVLLAWRSYVQTHLQDRLAAALAKLTGRVQSELI